MKYAGHMILRNGVGAAAIHAEYTRYLQYTGYARQGACVRHVEYDRHNAPSHDYTERIACTMCGVCRGCTKTHRICIIPDILKCAGICAATRGIYEMQQTTLCAIEYAKYTMHKEKHKEQHIAVVGE